MREVSDWECPGCGIQVPRLEEYGEPASSALMIHDLDPIVKWISTLTVFLVVFVGLGLQVETTRLGGTLLLLFLLDF